MNDSESRAPASAYRRTVLILNPQSRNGAAATAAAFDRLLELGPVHAVRSEDVDHALAAIHEFGGKDTRVVLGGGDGTLSRMLDAVLESGSTLGVLPLGTANDFARSLQIPLDLDEALDVICTGHTRQVDVGEVNDETFLNAVGVGLGPELTREMDAEDKSQLGVLAYPVALLSVLNESEPFRIRLEVDGTSHELDALQVTIGNGIHYGGGMTISADARLDDGRLSVLCIDDQSKLHLASQAMALRNGTTDESEDIRAFSGKEIRLETDATLDATADGELITRTPLVCRSRHRALCVFAPIPDTRSSTA